MIRIYLLAWLLDRTHPLPFTPYSVNPQGITTREKILISVTNNFTQIRKLILVRKYYLRSRRIQRNDGVDRRPWRCSGNDGMTVRNDTPRGKTKQTQRVGMDGEVQRLQVASRSGKRREKRGLGFGGKMSEWCGTEKEKRGNRGIWGEIRGMGRRRE